MNIRNTRELSSFAARRLEQARDPKRILLIYAGLTIGLSALVTVVNYILGQQMDQFGGLRNLGMRTTLSTVQSVLPILQAVFGLCLNLGFTAAMLRVARGQYVSPQTLRLGFDRFWVLLRCSLIKGLRYFSAGFLAIYAGIMIYMASPLSNNAMELLMPYMSQMSVLDSQLVLDEAVYAQFSRMIWPAYLICGILMAIFLVPMVYSFRMADYVIIDRPALGAMAALRESKMMMRGNRVNLFKLDLRLWWYYLATTLASVICYGDLILPMLGIQLPFGEDMNYFLFYGLYLAATFGIYYWMLDRVTVTYGLAYDAVKPEEKEDNGVVLGNIFQM